MCVETLRTGLHFSETIDMRGHMLRFTLKLNVFQFIFRETSRMCVETLRIELHFLR